MDDAQKRVMNEVFDALDLRLRPRLDHWEKLHCWKVVDKTGYIYWVGCLEDTVSYAHKCRKAGKILDLYDGKEGGLDETSD